MQTRLLNLYSVFANAFLHLITFLWSEVFRSLVLKSSLAT